MQSVWLLVEPWVDVCPGWVWAALMVLVVGVVVWWWMPREGVYAKEMYVGIDRPIPLHGRIDQIVWAGRALQVEELKTRERNVVYDGDVWQLSLYAYLLRRVQRKKVSTTGRVWVEVRGKRIPHEVVLKSEREVEALIERHQDLEAGRVKPTLCDNRNYCKRCAHHQVRCFPPVNAASGTRRASVES